ncbi:type VI secretion system baseplate subunit TssG, partial [Burkholderia pseudomallei]|nr:type VI secretion system baseplate subunit TssG [Burkholderia pseudomallei]
RYVASLIGPCDALLADSPRGSRPDSSFASSSDSLPDSPPDSSPDSRSDSRSDSPSDARLDPHPDSPRGAGALAPHAKY